MLASKNHQFAENTVWLCLALLALILSFGLSWSVLIPLSFGYEWLYSVINIDQHIATYGSKNTLRQGFEQTTEGERFRLFSAIVTAIHQQGEGLDSLVYHNAQGTAMATLLTHDEVVHLQDVAILIERMKVLLIASIVFFLGLSIWVYRRFKRMPTFRSLLITVFVFLALAIIIILLIGPHKVFYTLHLWVFPAEHKWFFYYEESLMSTMMKAPDLFAYIAILLLALAMPIFVLIMWTTRRVLMPRIQKNAAN